LGLFKIVILNLENIIMFMTIKLEISLIAIGLLTFLFEWIVSLKIMERIIGILEYNLF
jgi:hypothetical protein